MASVKSNLKNNAEDKSNDSTKKSLRWAEDVMDNESIPKKAKKQAKVNATEADTKKAKPRLCSFCGKNPACLRMKASWKGKEKKQSLCLLHYYSSSAVFADPEHIVILDPTLVTAQLKGDTSTHKKNKLNVQDLFAEAYCQLQSELAQESLSVSVAPDDGKGNKDTKKRRSSDPPINDPLSIIHDLGRSTKKRKAPPPPSFNNDNNKNQGGFLKAVPIPERLKKTQEQQAKWQAEQLDRMKRAAKAGHDTSQRREPTRRSVWNSVLDQKDDPKAAQVPKNTHHEIDLTVDDVTCSCGSTSVVDLGNITSRNADVRKGEVWGSGGRENDVVLKYQCNKCGKTWQETG